MIANILHKCDNKHDDDDDGDDDDDDNDDDDDDNNNNNNNSTVWHGTQISTRPTLHLAVT